MSCAIAVTTTKVADSARKFRSQKGAGAGSTVLTRLNSCSTEGKRTTDSDAAMDYCHAHGKARIHGALSLCDLPRTKIHGHLRTQSSFQPSNSEEILELDSPAGDRLIFTGSRFMSEETNDSGPEGIRAVTHFLSKVKRQICKHALETSSDWPSLPLTMLKDTTYSAHRVASATPNGIGIGASSATAVVAVGINAVAVAGSRFRQRGMTLPHQSSVSGSGSSGGQVTPIGNTEASNRLAATNGFLTSNASEKRRALRERQHHSIDVELAPSILPPASARHRINQLRWSTLTCEDDCESEMVNSNSHLTTSATKVFHNTRKNTTAELEVDSGVRASANAVFRSTSDVGVMTECISVFSNRSSERRSNQSLQIEDSGAVNTPKSPTKALAAAVTQSEQQNAAASASASASVPAPVCVTVTTPVRECEYDEQGLTWDVYGAEYDPNELGAAIETHLQKIMQLNRDAVAADLSSPTADTDWRERERDEPQEEGREEQKQQERKRQQRQRHAHSTSHKQAHSLEPPQVESAQHSEKRRAARISRKLCICV